MCCKCWRQKCKNWEHLLVHCYHSEVWWVISCCSISALHFCDHLCDHLLIVSTVRQHLYPKQSLCLTLLLPLDKVAKHIRLLQQLERWATAKIPPRIFILWDSIFRFFPPQALFGTQEDMPDYFFSVDVLPMHSWGCSLSCTGSYRII